MKEFTLAFLTQRKKHAYVGRSGRRVLSCIVTAATLLFSVVGWYPAYAAVSGNSNQQANVPAYQVGSTFAFKDLVGKQLPLKNVKYGSWDSGESSPSAVVHSDGVRTYVSFSRAGSFQKPALLGKSFSTDGFEKGLYAEVNANFTGKQDAGFSFANGAIDGSAPITVRIQDSAVFYTDGTKESNAIYLSGTPLRIDPEKWYTFSVFVEHGSKQYSLTIRENGSIVFSRQGMALAADLDRKTEWLVFRNSGNLPVNIDSAVLRNAMAYSEDFARADTEIPLKGWSMASPPQDVTCGIKNESDRGRYLEIINNSRSSYAPAYTFPCDGYCLTSEQAVVEFDVRASKDAGSRRILFYDANGVENSVRAEFKNSGFGVLTVGKATVTVVSSGSFAPDTWHHVKFVLHQKANCYDVYVDNAETPNVAGITFYAAADSVGITDSSSLNTGRILIQTDAKSGTLDLDNIKIYRQNYTLSAKRTMSELSNAAVEDSDKMEQVAALLQLQQLGTGSVSVEDRAALLKAVGKATGDDKICVRSVASTVLGCYGSDSNKDLIGEAESDNYFTRASVCNTLVRNGISKEEIAKSIQNDLKSSNANQKKRAIMALGQLKTAAAATSDDLLAILRDSSSDIDLRLQALNSLWYVAENRLTPGDWAVALNTEGENYYQLMNKAEEAMADAKDGALPALKQLLSDKDTQVRSRAVSVLGKIAVTSGNARVILKEGLSDSDANVQWQTAQALSRAGDTSEEVKQKINSEAGKTSDAATASETAKVALTYETNPGSSMANDVAVIDNGTVTLKIEINPKHYTDPKNRKNIIYRGGDAFYLAYDTDRATNLLHTRGEYQNWASSNVGAVNQKEAPKTDPFFKIVKQNDAMVDVALMHNTDSGDRFGKWDMEQHYVLRKGESGYYFYSTVHHSKIFPDGQIGYINSSIRINPELFTYRMNSMDLQGKLITPEQLNTAHENQIMNETYRMADGNVWAKYAWEAYDKQTETYGACGDKQGIWLCEPARDSGGNYPEWCMSTTHETLTEPVILCNTEWSIWASQSFPFPEDKVCGPYFVYVYKGNSHSDLYLDAQKKTEQLKAQWPFDWMSHEPTYTGADKRGTVTGKLTVPSAGISVQSTMAANSHIILCYPDEDNNDRWALGFGPHYYQTQTDRNGNFTIPKVAADTYTLYAFVDGVYGELRRNDVAVRAGVTNDLGTLILTPKAEGKTLWQIGTPDRTGKEFLGGSDVRNYDEFLRYREFFPHDVDYTVGKSNPAKDWFFIQPAQAADGSNPEWKIRFNLNEMPKGQAILTFGIASARDTTLNVSVNGTDLPGIAMPYAEDSGPVIRGSLYGLTRQRTLRFNASLLKCGENTIVLRQPANETWLQYISYDFIRLETSGAPAPDLFADVKDHWTKEGGKPYDAGKPVTRGELMQLLCEAGGFTPGRYFPRTYSDVHNNDWYAGAVQAMYNKQILSESGTFRPDDTVTREEAARYMMKVYRYRITKMPDYDTSKVTDVQDTKFLADRSDQPFIKAALGAGIMKLESSGLFNPNGTVSRDDALQMMQQLSKAYYPQLLSSNSGCNSSSNNMPVIIVPGTPQKQPENKTDAASGLGVSFNSDTTASLTVNGAYQFRITSLNGKAPTLVVGTPGVFKVVCNGNIGSDYFYKVIAVGQPGDRAGIYVNGGSRLLIAEVKTTTAPLSDTHGALPVKQGMTYQFQLTADHKPRFVAGTPGVFSVTYAGRKGNNYYFKITATGKVGSAAGIYSESDKPIAIGKIAG